MSQPPNPRYDPYGRGFGPAPPIAGYPPPGAYGPPGPPRPPGHLHAAKAARLTARGFDTLIVGFIASVPYNLIDVHLRPKIDAHIPAGVHPGGFTFSMVIFFAVLGSVWFCYDWISLACGSSTPGKRLTNVEVVPAAGPGEVTAGMSARRAVVYPLSLIVPVGGVLFLLVDLVWLLAAPDARAAHDRAAGTIVIRRDPRRRPGGHPRPNVTTAGFDWVWRSYGD